ncbi:MAG: hypothetical protein QGF59_22590, partial [Pirellulaceae bacterium]|nr:hypothetical protein [Pirellulaceae bacterium]
ARIAWQSTDVVGADICKQGPLCAIYASSVFDDPDALNALASDDNLNSVVQLGEDEMQAYGRVCAMMSRLAHSQDAQATTIDTVVRSLEVSGLGAFTMQEWKHLISLRACLPQKVSRVLQTCQFNATAGRVRVKTSDFAMAAKLDPRAHWSAVSVLLHQYIGSLTNDAALSQGESITTFGGRKSINAKKLQDAVFTELHVETKFIMDVEQFILTMLLHYGETHPLVTTHNADRSAKELLTARGLFLSGCGRAILKVGAALSDAHKKTAACRTQMLPAARSNILDAVWTGRPTKIETVFRTELVKRLLYKEDSLPTALHPPPADETSPSQAPPHTQEST